MNKLLNILLILLSVVSCKPQNQELNSVEQTYSRIWGKKSIGFINQNGDTIIPLNKYKFLNPIDEEGMILGEYKGKRGYINIAQETLIPFKYENLSVFSNGLAPAKLHGKFGFIDRKGNVIIPFEYETESHFYKCGLAEVRKNNKYGFINKTGKLIIPLEFEKVRDNKADEFVCAMKNGKWAFFSCEGKQLTEFEFDQITESPYSESSYTYFKRGLCRVKKNGEFGFINSDFKEVVPFGTYDIAEPFQNNLAIVAKKNKYGVIDTLGNLILPLKYSLIEHPHEYSNQSELFMVKQDSKLQLLDKTAKPITEFNIIEYEWDSYRDEKSHHRYFVLKNDLGLVGTVSEKGNLQIPFNYHEIEPFDGKSVAIAKQKDQYGLVDFNNKVIYPFVNNQIRTNRFFDFFIVNQSGNFGMVNKTGEVILPFKYQNIEPCFYDDNERFIIKKNNLFGVIDINENVIIPIEYDEISNWVEYGPDEHFITKNGKKGLISREGKIVIPPDYDEILVDNSRLIKVKKSGLFGTVNWQNEIVNPIEYEEILWEWPYLTNKALDTVYLKKNGKYLSTDTNGKVLDEKVSEKFIDDKFGYLLNYR
ncbi:WG repeat-containing protein [uncultured Maribacter sp.]|uniref:WG repeat-containing protein n=1 Tax=uncultured Maribacter sp. TaxID=431308 RepID=UPI002614D37F|nr:WG repeat-containing protein [uncultured Maribacter sp.]